MKWKTLYGDILDSKDMTYSHIKNCIRQLRGRIIDPADVVGYDGLGASLTELSIREDNIQYEKRIIEFEKELNTRL